MSDWTGNATSIYATHGASIHSNGKSGGYSGASWVVKDENGKVLSYKDPRVSRIRSKTYPGIAKAMAEQWAGEADR